MRCSGVKFKSMYLFGDSHVRSYSNSSAVSQAIFMGPGKDINFVSRVGLLNVFVSFLSIIGFKKIDFMLVIGEPDARYATFKSWYVFEKSKPLKPNLQDRRITGSLRRIRVFLSFLNLVGNKPKILIGAASPDIRLERSLSKLNLGLKKICENHSIQFFDPNEAYTRSPNKNVFIGCSVYDDTKVDLTHLSSEISKHFDEHISQFSYDEHIDQGDVIPLNFEVLKYMPQFNCYRFLPNGIVKLVLKSNRLLRKIIL